MYLHSEYPTSVFCIIATEFCERFSFCGLRTILSLYLRNILLFSENASTVVYHVFIMGCYIVPLIGAICADSYFGRYRTIRNFALIYLVGNVLMCLAAVPTLDLSTVTLSVIGLVLIAIGTGGIKPCVAAFGAEQFNLPDQKDLLMHFFSIFYFTINLGGFVGMILTPIMKKAISCFGDDTCYALGFGFPAALMILSIGNLRLGGFVGMILTPIMKKAISCFGDDTCYALGFGFPAALMILSIVLFIIGKSFYKLKTPKRNVILQFIKCGSYALATKSKSSGRSEHWLDYARGKYNAKLIGEMKIVCAILFLYTPLPIFWSLFDQQGSRWTFQASHMDGNVLGTQIVPDQMQVVNPAMVLVLIPVFDRIFYPCFSKLRILENSLHRMAFGGIVAGLAFFSAGILELVLETTYPELPDKHHASINVMNTLPCDLRVLNPFNGVQIVKSSGMYRFKNIEAHNYTSYKLEVEAPITCGDIRLSKHQFAVEIISVEYQIDSVLMGINMENEIEVYVTEPVDFRKSLSGTPRVRIAYIKSSKFLNNVTVTLENGANLQDIYFVHDVGASNLAVSAYMELPQGIYDCKISCNEKKYMYENRFHFALGGVYSLVIREEVQDIAFVKLYTMSVPNSINILWQVPQYFLISVAEIMFGVAGLEFSFTQAPKSMKTVTIAGWYLSVAGGNFLVIIITQLNMFKSQAHEFFLFAVLIVADMMLFMEMASNYKFVPVPDTTTSSSCFMIEESLPFIDEISSENTEL